MSSRTCATHQRYTAGCERCRHATREALRRERAARRNGTFQPYIDASPTRQHIVILRQAGMSFAHIGELARISHRQIQALHSGESRRTHPNTAAAILAVEPVVAPNHRSHVDAVGAHRRVHALMAIGWTGSRIATAIGRCQQQLGQILDQQYITRDTAARIATAYDRLSMTPYVGRGSDEARQRAAEHGWPPPLAWDDDTIDDPAAGPAQVGDPAADPEVVERVLAGKPYDLNGRRLTITPADRYEVTRQLVLDGRGASAVARLLRCSGATAKDLIAQVCRDACLTEPAESEAS